MGLINADKSVLLVVDVQSKLAPLMYQSSRLIDNCSWLIKAATKTGVPVAASEQYPKGLGPTVPELQALIPKDAMGSKVHFSCASSGCLEHVPALGRDQIVICGIEAHVCVLQTALDYLKTDREVFVVADAISSRDPREIDFAIERMRHEGIRIVTKEMVLFEWLRQAGTPLFKELSTELLR